MSSSRSRRGSPISCPALLAVAASLLCAGVARAETAPGPVPAAAVGTWHEGDPVPTGYHRARRVKKGLVAGGAALFALPYLASAVAAAGGYTTGNATQSARGVLWIPAEGPFIMMGRSTTSAAGDVLLLLDGLAQISGLTLFVYGLASPATVLAPDDGEGKAKISLAPLVLRGASGAMLVGTF
jgi:hypothetical protein